MKKAIRDILIVTIIIFLIVLGLSYTLKNKGIDYKSISKLSSSDRLKIAGLVTKDCIFTENRKNILKEVLIPGKMCISDSMIFIHDVSDSKVKAFSLRNFSIVKEYFSSGKGPGEIGQGKLSLSQNGEELWFSDIDNMRLVGVSIHKSNKDSKTIALDFMPEQSFVMKDGQVLIKSFNLDTFLALIDSDGKILKKISVNTSSGKLKYKLNEQGDFSAVDTTVFVCMKYGSKIYNYSVPQGKITDSLDTPVSIPVPEPIVEKNGKSTTISMNSDKPVIYGDISANRDYVFTLYSGGIPSSVLSITDILTIDNQNIINVYSRKSSKYICSVIMPYYLKSIANSDNKLYGLTTMDGDENVKLVEFQIDYAKLNSYEKE